MKILFVYHHVYPKLWKDGLWRALQELENVTFHNLHERYDLFGDDISNYDFVLGWGAWGSPADEWIKNNVQGKYKAKTGLCIGGNSQPPVREEAYDVLFYETDWYEDKIDHHPNIVHAFGVNTDIYKPLEDCKIWDVVSVGAFAAWKRQHLLLEKEGVKLVIGEIQKDNPRESLAILSELLINNVMVSDMVKPETLALIYNAARTVYIPADLNGGGERAVLEARACGVDVEVEDDNPKLKELLSSPVYDHKYYADQLKKGINSCFNDG